MLKPEVLNLRILGFLFLHSQLLTTYLVIWYNKYSIKSSLKISWFNTSTHWCVGQLFLMSLEDTEMRNVVNIIVGLLALSMIMAVFTRGCGCNRNVPPAQQAAQNAAPATTQSPATQSATAPPAASPAQPTATPAQATEKEPSDLKRLFDGMVKSGGMMIFGKEHVKAEQARQDAKNISPNPEATGKKTEAEKAKREEIERRAEELRAKIKETEKSLILAKAKVKANHTSRRVGSWKTDEEVACENDVKFIAKSLDIMRTELSLLRGK